MDMVRTACGNSAVKGYLGACRCIPTGWLHLTATRPCGAFARMKAAAPDFHIFWDNALRASFDRFA